jgi:hypothetical protein
MGSIALVLQIIAIICLVIAWDGRPLPKDRPKRWEFMGYALLVLSFMLVGLNVAIHAIGHT